MGNGAAVWATVAVVVWLTAGVVALARRRPVYRHVRDTISELGEFGARDQRLAALGVFLPVGTGSAVVAVLADPPGARFVAGSLAIGYLVAAVAPCDPGCPPNGTRRNTIHLLGGVLEYLGVLAGLVVLAVAVDPWFTVLTCVVAAGVVAGAIPSLANRVGVIQRCVEAAAFLALLIAVS